ncbi:MAG: hypothetical protein RIE53_09135 [Rhodothermales bacterium]
MNRTIMTSARRAAWAAAVIAFTVASLFTGLDWVSNPGGLFRDGSGTAWAIVGETFWSWWWPTFLVVTVLIVTFSFVRTLRRIPRD